MNIAFICTEKLPCPAVKGGAIQIMIDGIIPFLRKNHKLTVFSITDPFLPEREVTEMVEFVRFPKETYEADVAEELKCREFDMIHVFNRPANIMNYKNAAPDSAYVLSLHNDMFSELKLSRSESIKAIESVDAITSVSKFIKNTVTVRFPQTEEKVHILYSGVDLEKFPSPLSSEREKKRQEMRKVYQVENKKVILFVGRLSKTKGPHLLIESLKFLIDKYPEAVLMIIGGKWFSDNTITDYVKRLHDLSDSYKGHVIFTGYMPADQIPSMLLLGDIFVCSSQWHEPLARVLYEAMAAGIPIVTTNRGGNAEVIEHGVNGIIIDDYDQPEAFARAIDQVLSQPVWAARMAKQGRQRVEASHQFNHVADQLEKIYVDILAHGNQDTKK
ncbi:glycosyltransferase family 4 protein [Bacillus sp. V5-8f]|uniref:glycosyltransferase family 4 protein n=1 Tax=Bacillus sp. V5-8f TaxID=2053044 RepID=UPI000C76B7D3|nr:glycosyltransferase family 4 protein [Bacillus sp. V5-8f]PLT32285.1 glycosyl transferase [Bacillus sp. V5-8f]